MSLPKYLTDGINVKKESIKQEKKIQRQLASGALWTQKGDLKDEENLYEVKYAVKGKSITVTKEMLAKIFKEAGQIGKNPILILEIGEYIVVGNVFYFPKPSQQTTGDSNESN